MCFTLDGTNFGSCSIYKIAYSMILMQKRPLGELNESNFEKKIQ